MTKSKKWLIAIPVVGLLLWAFARKGQAQPPPGVTAGFLAGYVVTAESAVTGSNIPIAGATVQTEGYSTTTDSEGYFRVELPAGEYQVTVSAPDYETQTVSLTVVGEQTTEQWFYLSRVYGGGAGGIGGYVKAKGGSSIAGATVTAGEYSTLANADGQYFMQVPAGALVVTASAPGYQSASQTVTVRENANTSVPTFYLVPLMTGGSRISTVFLSQPYSGHPYYDWLVANMRQWGWTTIYPTGSVILGGESGAPSAAGCKCSVKAKITKGSPYWKFNAIIVTRPDGPSDQAKSSGSGTDYASWIVNFSMAGTYTAELELYSSEDKVNWVLTDAVSLVLAIVI